MGINILIISNFFYPRIHIAAFRIEAFAKYLSKAGFTVTVLTEGEREQQVKWNNCTIYYVPRPAIEELGKFKKTDSRIKHYLRAAFNIIFNNLFIDNSFFWGKKAGKLAESLMKENRYDIILSSYGFHSPLKIAQKLRKKGYDFKWILDMRDEMSKNIFFPRFTRHRLRKMEKSYLKDADLVLSVSTPITDGFRELEPENKYLHVLNGFDFCPIEEESANPHLVISYVGSFYGQINPDNFFQALSELEAGNKLHSGLKVRIIGNQKPLNIPQCISGHIEEISKIPHDAVREELKRSDVLLIIHPTGRKGIYTGKLFDYLGANRFILALADPSDVISDVLRETNNGIIVDNGDITGIKKAVLTVQDMFYKTGFPKGNMQNVMKYTREAQINKLVAYIHNNWLKI